MYSETYFPWDRTLYFLPERCLKDVFGKDCFSDVMEIKSIGANFYLSLSMNIAWWACRPATKWGSGLLLPAFPSFPLQPRLCRKALPKGRSKGGTCSEMTRWETYCLAKRCRGNSQEEEWYNIGCQKMEDRVAAYKKRYWIGRCQLQDEGMCEFTWKPHWNGANFSHHFRK